MQRQISPSAWLKCRRDARGQTPTVAFVLSAPLFPILLFLSFLSSPPPPPFLIFPQTLFHSILDHPITVYFLFFLPLSLCNLSFFLPSFFFLHPFLLSLTFHISYLPLLSVSLLLLLSSCCIPVLNPRTSSVSRFISLSCSSLYGLFLRPLFYLVLFCFFFCNAILHVSVRTVLLLQTSTIFILGSKAERNDAVNNSQEFEIVHSYL